MKKINFEFLKTLASLENCIECVQDDVEKMAKYLPEEEETLRKGAKERAESLRFWFDHVITDYNE